MFSCFQTFKADKPVDADPISVEQAARLHNHAGVEFVDPRPAEAIASTTGIVPGARNISLGEIKKDALPPAFDDRSIHVITICQAGPMSAKAADLFSKLGFAKVSYVDGGTQAWLDAGLPTVR